MTLWLFLAAAAGVASNDPPIMSFQHSWITNDDYPPESVRKGEQGLVTVEWDIGADGTIHNCTTYQSSGYPRLDQWTCILLTRRGRYVPAKDQYGNPIVQHARGSFRWMLGN